MIEKDDGLSCKKLEDERDVITTIYADDLKRAGKKKQ